MSGPAREQELQAFQQRLKTAWSIESAAQWTPQNPACGQCSVTALVAHDLFGGDILKTQTPGGAHFYNRIDGKRWDFTVGQFDQPISFDDTPSNRKEALADTTPDQYAALKARLVDTSQ